MVYLDQLCPCRLRSEIAFKFSFNYYELSSLILMYLFYSIYFIIVYFQYKSFGLLFQKHHKKSTSKRKLSRCFNTLCILLIMTSFLILSFPSESFPGTPSHTP